MLLFGLLLTVLLFLVLYLMRLLFASTVKFGSVVVIYIVLDSILSFYLFFLYCLQFCSS